MKVNDFFCGAGGMGLGFKQAGYEIVGAWDFDKYAVQSYAHNVGDHVKQADITEMKGSDVPYADVWTFGFPCQDLSVAGKQAGMIKGKTRSGLFYEVMRLLEEVEQKPKVIMAENVKGLKKFLPELKEEYKSAGYIMYVKLFNSKYWGVPQNRERYFVVGIREDIDKGFFRYPQEQTSYVPKLSSILEQEVDEKFYIDNEKAKKIIEQAKERIELNKTHAALTVNRTDKRQNGRRAKEEEEPMFTLSTQDQHGIIKLGMLDMKGQENIRRVGLGGTICATDYKQPRPVLHGYRVRKLTPREYARLQGFPESYEQIVSNSQFYKQMGNAVTVNVAKAMAESIKVVV